MTQLRIITQILSILGGNLEVKLAGVETTVITLNINRTK